jgi:hypothetical protein
VLAQQDRAHQLASQAANQHVATCPRPNKLSLQQCHKQFPDGCSVSHPYDAYLDFLKGQDPDPSLAPTKVLTIDDFKNFESQLKNGLTSSNHATFANQFADLGEGNIYSVIAYLYFVEDTGKGTSCQKGVAETTNCKITAPDSADYHIGLGFNTSLAQSAGTHPKPCTAAFSALEKDSIVAEMTPFPRHSRHPNWSIASLSAHLGKQVKVVGQLMVDNDHFVAHDDCHFSPQTPTCWRSTVWEIHPVTKFYFCNVSSGCDASSPDSAWTDLDKTQKKNGGKKGKRGKV